MATRVDAATTSRPQSERAETRLERIELADPLWRAFVAARADALAIHRPEWAALLADCYGFEPFVLAVRGERGEIEAGLPVLAVGARRRRWVSLPFTDYCPVLGDGGVGGASLLRAADAARRAAGATSLELRSVAGLEASAPPVGFRHILELSADPDVVYARFHPSQVKRALQRVERDGALTLRAAERREDLTRVFYALHLATRRRLGSPVQPRRFFELLWDRIVEPGLGNVLLAYAGSRPVAAGVFLTSGDSLLYKYAASDRTAWSLRPNHLIIWKAIRDACAAGVRTLDFGRTELGHQGLRNFKASWGAREQPLVYVRLEDDGIAGAPLPSRTASAAVIRHAPDVVCRLIGELLYRYAA